MKSYKNVAKINNLTKKEEDSVESLADLSSIRESNINQSSKSRLPEESKEETKYENKQNEEVKEITNSELNQWKTQDNFNHRTNNMMEDSQNIKYLSPKRLNATNFDFRNQTESSQNNNIFHPNKKRKNIKKRSSGIRKSNGEIKDHNTKIKKSSQRHTFFTSSPVVSRIYSKSSKSVPRKFLFSRSKAASSLSVFGKTAEKNIKVSID
mmetsp:Transcript_25879/g.22923  ORF Transcript_25879/g.22923 Transcript_25879/m.22923 type:complete len:209 (-) Transcript_25879:72-698(-)